MKKPNSAHFERLRALLLEQEAFPVDFTVKFVGKNTESFKSGISRFEADHPTLDRRSRRLSAQANHVALTYVFSAKSADHIIAVLERVALIEDVLVIL